jgi:hypothetical protein
MDINEEMHAMSQEAVEKVLGRMLTDDIFRFRTKGCLHAACREEGYLLSHQELKLVEGSNLLQLDSVAEGLDSGIKRFATLNKNFPNKP